MKHIIQFHEVVVPPGESLVIDDPDVNITVDVLEVKAIGPDLHYRYTTTVYDNPLPSTVRLTRPKKYHGD